MIGKIIVDVIKLVICALYMYIGATMIADALGITSTNDIIGLAAGLFVIAIGNSYLRDAFGGKPGGDE